MIHQTKVRQVQANREGCDKTKKKKKGKKELKEQTKVKAKKEDDPNTVTTGSKCFIITNMK